MRIAAVALLVLGACGDDRVVAEEIAARSGTRLELHHFLYEDGTRQVDGSSFYDKQLHTECTPALWVDDIKRCVPVASESAFSDAACTIAVGPSPVMATRPPTHFIGYDELEDVLKPVRLYRAGARASDVTEVYMLRGDECIGPITPPSDLVWFATTDELPAQSMQTLHDSEVGAGRLSLPIQSTPDGMRVPGELFDRELGVSCTPVLREDGRVLCEPAGAARATLFADAACSAPAVATPGSVEVPAIAFTFDAENCTTYTGLANELTWPVYRHDGTTCVRAVVPNGYRVHALGQPLDLPQLDRTVEQVPDRRLQRVILEAIGDPGLRVPAASLVDSAIRAECRRAQLGEDLRCIPANAPNATTLYATGCALRIDVVVLPVRTCGRPTFARAAALDGVGYTLHAIADRVATPVYTYSGSGCTVYTPPANHEVHALGPALAPSAFARAVRYGARS